MITTPSEYAELLYKIQNQNAPIEAALIPSDEPIYQVDLNSRTISAPEFLSVEHEHAAEVIFFEVDRFYDNMDLTQTTCIIQYVNANNESYVYAVPFMDAFTHKDKLIIPWQISGAATAYPGNVTFIFRFFIMDNDSYRVDSQNQTLIPGDDGVKFYYNLATLPATSKVLHGLAPEFLSDEYKATIGDFTYIMLQELNSVRRDSMLYWVDV